jgi:hypothetical protein
MIWTFGPAGAAEGFVSVRFAEASWRDTSLAQTLDDR